MPGSLPALTLQPSHRLPRCPKLWSCPAAVGSCTQRWV